MKVKELAEISKRPVLIRLTGFHEFDENTFNDIKEQEIESVDIDFAEGSQLALIVELKAGD